MTHQQAMPTTTAYDSSNRSKNGGTIVIVVHLSPADLSALLQDAPATRYTTRALALPTPGRSVGQAWAQGDPTRLAAVLEALLTPRTVLRVGSTVVATGTTTATAVHDKNRNIVHVVLDDTDPITVVTRAVLAELGGHSHSRLLLGRWLPSGISPFERVTEHRVLVSADDVENVAADLLGASGDRVAAR